MIGFDFEGMIVLHVNSSQLCVNNNLPHMGITEKPDPGPVGPDPNGPDQSGIPIHLHVSR